MPRLSKAEAARHMRISRTTLYKLIHAGTLSVHPDGTIDPAELVRAVSTLSVTVHRGQVDGHQMDSTNSVDGQNTCPPSVYSEHGAPQKPERQLTSTEQLLVDSLREQLQAALIREQEYRAQIAWFQQHIDAIQQRYDRLLEAPHPLPPPPPPAPPVASPPRQSPWQRVRAFLGGRAP